MCLVGIAIFDLYKRPFSAKLHSAKCDYDDGERLCHSATALQSVEVGCVSIKRRGCVHLYNYVANRQVNITEIRSNGSDECISERSNPMNSLFEEPTGLDWIGMQLARAARALEIEKRKRYNDENLIQEPNN